MAREKKNEPIWPFMIPAILIASVWAGAFVLTSTPELRDESTAYFFGYFTGSSLLSSLVVWLVFYLAFFRPRAKIGKALGAFALMFALTFALQFAPLAVVNAIRGDEQQAQRQMEQSIARVTAMNNSMMADIDALHLQADEATGVRSKAHVADWLTRLRQAADRLERYDAALEGEAMAAREALKAMNLPGQRRNAYLTEVERGLGAQALLRRANAARLSELRKAAETLALLADNPDAWEVQNGAPAFYDTALLARYRALGGELQTLHSQRMALESALSAQAASAQEDHGGQAQESEEAERISSEGDEDRR